MEYPIELKGIEIAGIYIHEPGGLISNLSLCILSFILILSIGKPENSIQRNWKFFILFIGVGALGGSFTHGFPTYLGEQLFFWVWAIKNSFVPIANYFASKDVLPQKKWIHAILILKVPVVILALFLSGKFLPVVIDLAITYLVVIYFSNKLIVENRAYIYMRNAFILGLASGFLYIVKYDLNDLWFTHKDMVHVFILISLVLIYLGIRKSKALSYEQVEYPK